MEAAGEGPEAAANVWTMIELEEDQGTLGLFAPADQKWILARITRSGRDRMAQIASDHSSDWQGLGVAILHRLVMETLLGATNLPKPKYVHLVDEVISGLRERDDEGDPYAMAALVMPATLDQIQSISEHAERMPAKSTYFYPKLLSGLVINPLE